MDNYKRPLDQIFFVYDHSVVVREEDDPKDAIVYFYPPNFAEDTQCLICGQLMGMVNFLNILCSSKPKLYKLRKMKLSTKHEGNFTIAMAHDVRISDTLAEEKATYLFQLFSTYHGSLTRLLKHCNGNRELFNSKMISIWNCYLPFIRYYGNNIKSTFHAVPTVQIPKNCGWIFLKCSHLLQWLKRKPQLLAGFLLYKNKVLCTQLTSDLTARLLLIKSSQNNFPGEKITPDFDLPYGVKIFSVYLQDEEYKLYSKQTMATKIMTQEEASEATTPETHTPQTSLATHGEEHTLPQQQLLDEVASGIEKCNIDLKDIDLQLTSSVSQSSDDQLPLARENEIGKQCVCDRTMTFCAKDGSAVHSDGAVGEACSCKTNSAACEGANVGVAGGDRTATKGDGIEEHKCSSVQSCGDKILQENSTSNCRMEQQHGGFTDLSPRTLQDIANGNVVGYGDRASIGPCNGTRNGVNSSSQSTSAENFEQRGGILQATLDSSLKDGASSKPCEPVVIQTVQEIRSVGVTSGTNSGACIANGESNNVIIATAVSRLDQLRTEDLLPKVLVDHDTSNTEDEPFEIHINPLDSESSPEHSDSSSTAKPDDISSARKQKLETVTDDDEELMIPEVPQRSPTSEAAEMHEGNSCKIPGKMNDITSEELDGSSERISQSRNTNSTSSATVLTAESLTSSRIFDPNGTTNTRIPEDFIPVADRRDSHQETVDSSTLSNSTLSLKESATPTASVRETSTVTSVSSSNQNMESPKNSNSVNHPDPVGQSGPTIYPDSTGKPRPNDPSPVETTPAKDIVKTEELVQDCDGVKSRVEDRGRDNTPLTGEGLKRTDGSNKKVHNHPISSLRKDPNQVEGMKNAALFIQPHSDTCVLIFLAERDLIKDRPALQNMIQTFAIQLADLERELQHVLTDQTFKQDPERLYNFLQFNPFERSLKSNISSMQTTQDKEFIHIMDNMHDVFSSDESIDQLVIRGQQTTVLGHQNASHQTFYQPLRASSQGGAAPGSSSPIPAAYSSHSGHLKQGRLELQAERTLLNDHGIRFL